MARDKSPERKKALDIWLKSGREKKLSDIADELGVSASVVRKWKSVDKWNEIPLTGRPKGAPKGNKNAKGNKGGKGGPKGNDYAVTHGFFRKFMPQDPEFLEIRDIVETMDPVDMIYENILSLFQQIIWGRRITFVKNKDDITKVLKKKKPGMFGTEQEWEYQHAWDKYNNAMKAQAAVMREFRVAVKQFLAVADENDERRLKLDAMQVKIDKTRLEIERLRNGDGDSEDDLIEDWVEAVTEDEGLSGNKAATPGVQEANS
ncbi:Phage terminase small subunit [compost metagenome]